MRKVFLVILAMIFVFSVFCTSISVSAATVDKSELGAIVTKAIVYKRSDFDIDNTIWNDFQAELANAIMVLNDDTMSQQEIDNAKNNLIFAMDAVEQYRKNVEGDSTQPSYTQNPNGENNNSTGGVASTEATSVVTAKPTKPATEPEPETRPKSTTPFLKGGFIEIGCDASVALSALAIVGIIGSALVIKKKHD